MPDMSNAAISFPMFGEGFVINFKPYITLFGWNFHWYGIIIALGCLLAVVYMSRRAAQFGITDDNVVDMLIFAVPPAIVGARLYYVIFSDWDFSGGFLENLGRIARIWEGGLAIYGAVICGLISCAVYAKVKKIYFGVIADVGVLGLLIGQAVGRWGNFTNREAYGYRTSVPWKMGLTNQYGTFYYHPCFLYESLWNVLGFVLLHFYSKRRKYDGEIFVFYMGWYGIGRLTIEGLRQDSLYLWGTDLRVSQMVAVCCILISVVLTVYNRAIKNRDPDELWVNRNLTESEQDLLRPLVAEVPDEAEDGLADAYNQLRESRNAEEDGNEAN